MNKAILLSCLLMGACASQQPTVESINAKQAAIESKCAQQGYKRGTRDFITCTSLASQQDLSAGQDLALGAGLASVGLMALSAFSDERLKRDIVPMGTENGFQTYRFKYIWSDDEYIGVIAQEIEHSRPDAVIVDRSGFLKVDYTKIGVAFRRVE